MMTTIKTIIRRPGPIAALFVALGMCWSAVAADMGGRRGPISFKNDVVPVFMRGGCNGGACHGAGTGKDGFRLSLFGYDPEGDYYRIVEEYVGRRINLAVPEKSLLLEKAAGRVPHTGGEIFKPDSDYYQTLLAWIEQGAPQDPPDTPEPLRLELTPEKLTFTGSGEQQAEVIAHYSDGSRRNVADLAVYLASNDAVASIDDTALIRGNKPGAAHVFARFNRFTVGAEVVVIPSGEFSFPDIEPQNYIDVYRLWEELANPNEKNKGILPPWVRVHLRNNWLENWFRLAGVTVPATVRKKNWNVNDLESDKLFKKEQTEAKKLWTHYNEGKFKNARQTRQKR